MPGRVRLREGDAPEVAGMIQRVEQHVSDQTAVSRDVISLRSSVDTLTVSMGAMNTSMAVMTTKLESVVTAIDRSAGHEAKLAGLEATVAGLSRLLYWALGLGGSAIIGLTIAVVSAWLRK